MLELIVLLWVLYTLSAPTWTVVSLIIDMIMTLIGWGVKLASHDY